MKPALALDMDDIIYPFMENLVPLHNQSTNSNFTVEDYLSFEFSDIWGGSVEQAVARVDQYFDVLHEADPSPAPLSGADVAIARLAEHYRLFIVTSRFDELHARTHSWIDRHFPSVFEDVFLCNSYVEDGRGTRRTKGSVVEQLDAVGLVDDSAIHVTEVARQGRTAILFGDYPWNRKEEIPANAHRARDWTNVTAILLGDQI